jgi:1-acyl-sn-glycerol-3-phosphate acyltransferase
MGLLYGFCLRLVRGVFFCTLRTTVDYRHLIQRDGAFVLAVTHLSHLEPLFASALSERPIDWIARKEFFWPRPMAWFLHGLNTIRIDRQGRPVLAMRTAIHRLRAGRVVGIFPEGGVVYGPAAAIRGGAIKRGCCTIAIRAGAPIVPCVMLGTDKLNKVKPWLPFRRAHIWVAYGEAIYPPADTRSTRATREELARKIRAAFGEIYAGLRQRHQICESTVP